MHPLFKNHLSDYLLFGTLEIYTRCALIIPIKRTYQIIFFVNFR